MTPWTPAAEQPLASSGHIDVLLSHIAPSIRPALRRLPEQVLLQLEEIRLRVDRPVVVDAGGKSLLLHRDGPSSGEADPLLRIGRDEFQQCVQLVTRASLYALEEELKRGYVTLPGGHRVGLTGRALLDSGGLVRGMKEFSSLCYRVSRAVPGAADSLRSVMTDQDGRIRSVLVISPPQCGKTTLLRDIARQLATGTMARDRRPKKVALVDERSELAGSVDGCPQHDVGWNTDVLDACPKAQGIMMVIRSMSPDVVITDEVGRFEDRDAIWEAAHAGVAMVASVHGAGFVDVSERPVTREIVASRVFDYYVVLSRRFGPGTVEAIYDTSGNRVRIDTGRGEARR